MADQTSPLEGEHINVDQATLSLLADPPAEEAQAEEPSEVVKDAADEITEETAAEEEPSGEEAEAQEATEETEDTEEAEPEDLPAIDPPASWKQEDRESFAELPRHLQSSVADQARTREVGVNQKLQEAAELSKSANADKQQAANERQQYQQYLEYLVPIAQNGLAQEFQDIKTAADVQNLASEEPDRYARWRASQDALQIATEQQARQQQISAQEQETNRVKRVADAEVRLVQTFPEWKDETRGRKEIGEAKQYLADSYGLPQEALQAMIEPYQFQIVRKAMAYDRAQKAKDKAVTKKVPKVLKPGAAPSKVDKGATDRAAKLNNLAKKGRDWEASAVDLLLEGQ